MADSVINAPHWLRRRPPQAAAEDRGEHVPAPAMPQPVRLSQLLTPHLEAIDQALDEAHRQRDLAMDESERLRVQNEHLTGEVRYQARIMQDQSERIDELTRQCAEATQRANLLEARMVNFGKAAATIVEESTREAKSVQSYAPPAEQRQAAPAPGLTRPVRELRPIAADDVEMPEATRRLLASGGFGA